MNNNNLTQKTISGMIWKFAERILAQGVSFIVSVVLARILIPEDYGTVALVTVFITIANVMVSSGLPTALVQKKNANDVDFSTILYCNMLISILIYVVLYCVAPFAAKFYNIQELTLIIRVFSIKIIIAGYNSVQQAYVQKHMLFRKFFYSTLGGTILSGMIGIIMALQGFGVWALIAQYLINSIVDMFILMITIEWRPKLLFSWNSAKGMINYGWKILAADLSGTVCNNLSSLLIGRYYTSAQLAYYNKGKQIPELISNNIDTTISSVLFPALAHKGDNIFQVKSMVQKSMRLTSFLIFPIMFGLVAVAEPFIRLLLTDKWIGAVPFLQCICIAKSISVVSNANMQALKAIGRSDVLLKLELYKKPIFILMVFVSININIYAVALSMPLYALYGMIVNMKPNSKFLNFSIKEQLLTVFPAFMISIIMVIVVKIVALLPMSIFIGLIIQVLIGACVYIVLSVILKLEASMYLLNYIKKFTYERGI